MQAFVVAWVLFGLWFLHLGIGAAVFGLSVQLWPEYKCDQIPTPLGVSVFAGCAAMTNSFFGLANTCVDFLDLRVLMIFETLVSIFYLGTGVYLCVNLPHIASCTTTDETARYSRITNNITNGGCSYGGVTPIYPQATEFSSEDLTIKRCQIAQADYIFEFAGFLLGLWMVWLVHLHRNFGGNTTPDGDSTSEDGDDV
ncbi:hypothetical protein F4777DRAFT_350740 [Nemania sp. FL0916]|nr:hypothetical protein F4777DRAFT_350740 [Nemania sp. FL0916]